jgi:TolB-like protein
MSDPTDEYFADGLTEDLITALAKSRHLSVIARNSTFRYKGKSVKVQEAARELGAHYVVEGSLRRYGNRVRVTAQLIDAETGAHVWANRFDQQSDDIFALQDQIVSAILAQLTFSLVDAAVTSRRTAPTSSLKAYDHVLRGRAAWRRGSLTETLEHYLKAIEVDPNYGIALACLAFYYSEDPYMQVTGLKVEEAVQLAKSYADRAVAADDGDSFLHHTVGSAFLNLGEHDRARHHLELAVTLNPHFPNSIINLGCALAYAGDHQEGLAMMEKVFALEPRLPPGMRAVPFYVHCLLGDCKGAAADFARIETPYPSLHLLYGLCLLMAGRETEAERALAAMNTGRTIPFDVEGFARFWINGLKLSSDKERWRDAFKTAGYRA